MKKIVKKVPANFDGMRLDLIWVQLEPELSRRKIRQIIDVGGAYHNRKRVRIASRTVNVGDEIVLQFNLEGLKEIKKSEIKFIADDIIFTDDNFVIVNKPPLMPSQATKDQSIMHVESCLKKHYEELKKNSFKHFQICHRLDKETSGVLIVARNKKANAFVMEQFKHKEISKFYLALCFGKPKSNTWEVKCFLTPIDKRTGMVGIVRSGGKVSLTKFKMLAYNANANISLIACFPETGRSHQLRVHLASSGLPILGDKKYCEKNIEHAKYSDLSQYFSVHHMLHAYQLKFQLLDHSEFKVSALPPKGFISICRSLEFVNELKDLQIKVP